MGGKGQNTIKISGVLRGTLISLGLFLAGNLFLAFLMTFTTLAVDLSLSFLFVVNYIALFLGGIVAAYQSEKNGWLNGGLVGIFYIAAVIILGNLLFAVSISINFMGQGLFALLVAGLGGMIGINIL